LIINSQADLHLDPFGVVFNTIQKILLSLDDDSHLEISKENEYLIKNLKKSYI